MRLFFAFLLFLSLSTSLPSAEVTQAGVCVYGGTSGAVVAAVQVARMGKSVVLAAPGKHLGGMTSGGLSAVDIGNPRTVGGITRKYFTKLAATAGELVATFIEACLAIGDDMDLRWFSKHDALPNHKWDFNTATFGGNLPGASWAWPEATYTEREKITRQHENYHRGLLHFLATDPRVPEIVCKDMQHFGLPKDEFTDSGGWPHQLYIGEARRMVSDLVLTEHHTFRRRKAARPVSLGSYGTDVHEIQRIAKEGVVICEGKLAGGRNGITSKYAILYQTLERTERELQLNQTTPGLQEPGEKRESGE